MSYKAVLVSCATDMKGYISSPNELLSKMETLFAPIKINATAKELSVSFYSIRDAKKWCSKMARKYNDSAVLVGTKQCSLIEVYDSFRINTGLYNLIQYVWGGKLRFKGDKWITTGFSNKLAEEQCIKWVRQYLS